MIVCLLGIPLVDAGVGGGGGGGGGIKGCWGGGPAGFENPVAVLNRDTNDAVVVGVVGVGVRVRAFSPGAYSKERGAKRKEEAEEEKQKRHN